MHTREEHSIGVYVLVNKVIEHLTEIGDIHLSKYERKLVSTVALLRCWTWAIFTLFSANIG